MDGASGCGSGGEKRSGENSIAGIGESWAAVYINPDDDPQRIRKAFSTIDCDFVVLGHTHRPMVLKGVVENATLINPGSVGFPLDGDPSASYALLDTEDASVYPRKITYDAQLTLKDADFLPPVEREMYANILRNGRMQ